MNITVKNEAAAIDLLEAKLKEISTCKNFRFADDLISYCIEHEFLTNGTPYYDDWDAAIGDSFEIELYSFPLVTASLEILQIELPIYADDGETIEDFTGKWVFAVRCISIPEAHTVLFVD